MSSETPKEGLSLMAPPPSPWEATSAIVRGAVNNALAAFASAEAIAIYSRWWQFESWLRSLTYVELYSLHGSAWHSHINQRLKNRATRDEINAYMASPDADDPLAYYDIGDLFELIDTNWTQFEPSLLSNSRWTALKETAIAIRLRIAHCRRPHSDDLARLEQILRDIESGARLALQQFATHRTTERLRTSALVRAWRDGKHPTAQRLIDHAERQYNTSFRLAYSVRPWALDGLPIKHVFAHPGFLWVASWHMGGRVITPQRFWDEFLQDLRGGFLYALQSGPSDMQLVFSAMDNEKQIADLIGYCFDALLTLSRYDRDGEMSAAWSELPVVDLHPRYQVRSMWAFSEYTLLPNCMIFNA